ncbi:ATP-binding protein [Candidatus Woesearchaeota archaeon]|nr:ATP-binding protein [Candidatus Woesearchaeota archaeon]
MLTKELLKDIVLSQKEEKENKESGVLREIHNKIDLDFNHIIIISGIRRSGKSTLLRQLMKKIKNAYYFNFEDYRSLNFELFDFQRLEEVFEEIYDKNSYYFFDEIQNVPEWERYIRTKFDQGKRCIISGSNALLLSKELGTKLTGRHLRYELFPFSYNEFLIYYNKKASVESFTEYFEYGGFPEFLRTKDKNVLQELLRDIIMKDVIIRYKIRESKIVEQLLLYLLTNCSKEFSYNELAKTFNIGSPTSVINYIFYFEDSYLLFTIPKFDYSLRKQLANPKKIYFIDHGLIRANTASFSSDNGRILENIVFLQLRKKYKEIYYYKGEHECDFLVREKGKLIEAIQVCYEINQENIKRELAGVKEAIQSLHIKEGKIITFNQEDTFDNIKVMPVWKWLMK